MTATAHPALLAAQITVHLHPEASRAILDDPRWADAAIAICARYGSDANLLHQHLQHLADRLNASPAHGTWIARNTYSPATWLAHNLT